MIYLINRLDANNARINQLTSVTNKKYSGLE